MRPWTEKMDRHVQPHPLTWGVRRFTVNQCTAGGGPRGGDMRTTRAAVLSGGCLSAGRCRYCSGGAKRRSLRVKSGLASPVKRHNGQCGVPSAPMVSGSLVTSALPGTDPASAKPWTTCTLTQRTPWLVQISTICAPPSGRASTSAAAHAECRLTTAIQAMSHQPQRRAKDRFMNARSRRERWWSLRTLRKRVQRHQSHLAQMVHSPRVGARYRGQLVSRALEDRRCTGSTEHRQMRHDKGCDEQAAMWQRRKKTRSR